MMRVLSSVAITTVMAVLMGISYFYLTPVMYEGDLVVGLPLYRDLGDEEVSALSQVLLPRLRGSSAQEERNRRFMDLLGSIRVAEKLEDQSHPERVLFDDEWDAASETWHPPSGRFDRLNRWLGSVLGIEMPWSQPDAVRLAHYVRHNVAVNSVFSTGSTKIQAWNADPIFVKSFMTGLVQAAQDVMREDAEKHYRDELSSIDAATAKFPQMVLQDNLRDLKQKANKNLLLAGAGQYGISIIDGPQVFNERAIFDPIEIIGLISCSGAYLGLIVSMIRGGFVRRQEDRAR